MNQEAIEFFEALKQDKYAFSARDKKMFDIAIQALKEPTRDLISRQAVHEAIEKWAGSMSVLIALPTREIRPLLDSIHKLPSVNPQPKTGHWIEHPEIKTITPEIMFYECSECGDKQCFCKSDIHKKHFCNYCGARMVEPQAESEDK